MKTVAPRLKKFFSAMLVILFIAGIAVSSPEFLMPGLLENEFIKNLKKSLDAFNAQRPEERIYVHLDKPMYEPGDDIWLSTYIREANSMKPSTQSDFVYVELINPKGAVENSIKVLATKGIAAGDFKLADDAPGGMYKIRAFTQWMKNEGEKNVFEKDIQVQEVLLPNLKMKLDFERKAFGSGDEVIAKLQLNTNDNKVLANHNIKIVASLQGKEILSKVEQTDEEGLKFIRFTLPENLKSNDGLLNVIIDYNGSPESISRAIPIVLNKINLQLLPEGGDLVEGLESKVAFRATNEFGKPADIEGALYTEKGSKIATFSSFHQGMGHFTFAPQAGEKYLVKITRPDKIDSSYALPEAMPRGYVLSVDNSNEATLNLSVNTTENEELSIIAQVRNKMYYHTVLSAKRGANNISFPLTEVPMGVMQVTLFDSKSVARCERLVFVNKNKQLSVDIKTDKEKYLPREKVKMTVSVKDERGMPMPANLSIAVANDQFLAFADDKSGNILSQLLLQQDIKEKVEEPAFYFDKKESKADKGLDYLLMTAGWRHFTWETIQQNNWEAPKFAPELAIVGGTVINAVSGKPLAGAKIKYGQNTHQVSTDANGKFVMRGISLDKPVNLISNAIGYRQQATPVSYYNSNLTIYMYDEDYYKQMQTRSRNNEMGVAENAAVPMEDNFPQAAMGAGGIKKAPQPVLAAKNVELMKKNDAVAKPAQAPQKAGAAKAKDVRARNAAGMPAAQLREERKAKLEVEADRMMADDFFDDEIEQPRAKRPNTMIYRARTFAAPIYKSSDSVATRSDFRNTIYWNPNVEIDKTGKATVEFFASDDITSFRATAEGVAIDGMLGRAEKTFFTQLPFSMSAKVPVEVVSDDLFTVPLILKNNTASPIGGTITVDSPEGIKAVNALTAGQTIMPGAVKVVYLDYKVLSKIGYGDLTITFKACGMSDAFTQRIKMAPKGFPKTASFASQEGEKEYEFVLRNVVNGSLQANFSAYPNVVSDLMKGVEGILREPYGCFEQTSMSSYPNAMVLDYLKTTDSKDEKSVAYASALLDKGYGRLTTFETKEKGYEWFGSNPGHEALTAFGLMQFNDMRKVGAKVDNQMVDRTANWLMSRKDGKGGFDRNTRALDNFGRASKEITDAYIVYSLSEAGFTDIKKEFESAFDNAMSSKDPYMLGLVANAAYNLKEVNKAEKAMDALKDKQSDNGSFNGSTHSITYSQGHSLLVETTSLAVLAMIKSNGKYISGLNKAVQFLVGARSGGGLFGNSQGTVMALKALTEYAKFNKKTSEDGTILVYVDGEKVAEKKYLAGERSGIELAGLEKYVVGEGKHKIKVKYVGAKNPLPYSILVTWNTFLPESDATCVVDLKTKLSSKSAAVGETVRFTATLTNKKNEGIPCTMAMIGIPAGFTVQPWQLKEMQEKNVFDYYEIKGNSLAIYYRCMAPSLVKELNFDLKAEIPGEYEAPASSAYLYYTNEFKTWAGLEKITIRKS